MINNPQRVIGKRVASLVGPDWPDQFLHAGCKRPTQPENHWYVWFEHEPLASAVCAADEAIAIAAFQRAHGVALIDMDLIDSVPLQFFVLQGRVEVLLSPPSPPPGRGPCPDCRATPGEYVGLGTREKCRTCGGSALAPLSG